jgi:outer membrane protein assembly factor BamE (lipoprotein component of BamABCDE complex)
VFRKSEARSTRSAAAWALCAVLLSACATSYSPASLKPGDSIDLAKQQMGPPTGEYRLADGGTRLEFARGPRGKQTFMLDFDAQGRLIRSVQVLDEAHFNELRAGMSGDQVLATLGRPAEVWSVRYHRQTVWSYRFEGPFCQLFHVGLTPAGVVEDTSYGPDPLCERRDLDKR